MNKLPSHPADRLLERVRAAAPDASSRAHVLAGLEQRIRAGAAVDLALAEAPFTAARLARASGRSAATISSRALLVLRWAGFGLVMGALGYWWGRHDAHEVALVATSAPSVATIRPASSIASPAIGDVPRPPASGVARPTSIDHAPADLGKPRAPSPTSVSPAAEKPRPPARRPPPPAALASGEDTLTLAQALELMRRAEAELRAGDASAARVVLGELDRRAPAKLLREERLVARALAACLDEDVSAAERYAAQLIAESPSSIYRGRLEGSCANGSGEKR